MFMTTAGALALVTTVSVTSREVRVRDVVQQAERLDPLVAGIILLKLRAGRALTELPTAAITSLLRRKLPGVRIASPAKDIVIENRPADKQAPRLGCFATGQPLRSGDPVTRDALIVVPCREVAMRTIGYGNGVAIARQDLPAGSYVGQALVGDQPAVARGARLMLRSIAGLVTIEREVVTLQAARSGQHVFVRDADGGVMAAPLALDAAQ